MESIVVNVESAPQSSLESDTKGMFRSTEEAVVFRSLALRAFALVNYEREAVAISAPGKSWEEKRAA